MPLTHVNFQNSKRHFLQIVEIKFMVVMKNPEFKEKTAMHQQ